jgi:hypothetical protein
MATGATVAHEPEDLRDDIAAALGQGAVLTGHRRGLLAVSGMLRRTERVLAAAAADRVRAGAANVGIVLVTDERVIFVFGKVFGHGVDEIPIATISAMRVSSRASGTIDITGPDVISTQFTKIAEDRLDLVAGAIRQAAARPAPHAEKAPTAAAADADGPAADAPEEPATAPEDIASRLRELAALHASGDLTDSEFAAAKAKLLA